MQYFQRLATGVNVFPLMHALQKQPHLWDANTFRTSYPNTPHAGANDVMLRFSTTDKMADHSDVSRVIGDGACVWHPAALYLPQAQPIVMDLMRAVGAHQLDRLLITRLRPGKRIEPHADSEGPYVNDSNRARYHVVLQGGPGNLFRCGDETVAMHTGDIWWFQALAEHECQNNGDDDRVHLLVDLVTWPVR